MTGPRDLTTARTRPTRRSSSAASACACDSAKDQCSSHHDSGSPSTVHRIRSSCHLNRLTHVDRATGEPVRRYEHDHPGAMLHVDVKKLGNIPDGGGWRYVGRRQGEKNRAATPGKLRSKYSDPLMGKAYVHTVIDDHSRVAYAEIHDDETAFTATAVLVRAVEWFNARGVTVERVLSDNGGAYRSHLWRDTCMELGIRHKRTRPYPARTGLSFFWGAAPSEGRQR